MQEHERHRYLGEPDEDLILSLEPDQLVDAVYRPLPRRQLGRRAAVALIGLRLFLLVVTAAVLFAFISGVVRGPIT